MRLLGECNGCMERVHDKGIRTKGNLYHPECVDLLQDGVEYIPVTSREEAAEDWSVLIKRHGLLKKNR